MTAEQGSRKYGRTSESELYERKDKKIESTLWCSVSSLCRGHANLLCNVTEVDLPEGNIFRAIISYKMVMSLYYVLRIRGLSTA